MTQGVVIGDAKVKKKIFKALGEEYNELCLCPLVNFSDKESLITYCSQLELPPSALIFCGKLPVFASMNNNNPKAAKSIIDIFGSRKKSNNPDAQEENEELNFDLQVIADLVKSIMLKQEGSNSKSERLKLIFWDSTAITSEFCSQQVSQDDPITLIEQRPVASNFFNNILKLIELSGVTTVRISDVEVYNTCDGENNNLTLSTCEFTTTSSVLHSSVHSDNDDILVSVLARSYFTFQNENR